MQTIDQIAEAAEAEIHAVFWKTCDARQAAVDPSELTSAAWAVELLAEAYDIALRCQADPAGWQDARGRY